MPRTQPLILIVLLSFVHYGSSSTTTITPSPSIVNGTAGPSPSQSVTDSVTLPQTTPSVRNNDSVSHAIVSTKSDSVTPSSSATRGTSTTQKTFKATVTVDEPYQSAYKDLSSNESKAFIKNFTRAVNTTLSSFSGFVSVKVTNLTTGSVVVDFDIKTQQSTNATEENIIKALKTISGYTVTNVTVKEVIITPSPTSTASATASATVSSSPGPGQTPTSSTKGTEFWDKAIDRVTPLGTFIIAVVAVALVLILLIALICVCCKYRRLKKKTHFPQHMAINDSEWIRSSDDLLMWERNLRASEVKTTNGISNRPYNDKRP